jgi:hypothetical protein
MTASFYVGDAVTVMNTLPERSVDLILTSPPFLALRSYLPVDHPDKPLEGGSQATPGAYVDWLIDVVEACDRLLAPHGSVCFELGDTYAGSGGGGGDYLEGGWREGQQQFAGSQASMRESNAAHWRQKNAARDSWPADKSLTLIPELFRMSLVYGFNPLTGRTTRRWRLRNVIRWVRPNPPVGALGDKFRPATSELMVFCRTDEAGRRRFFDLDAVRNPDSDMTISKGSAKNRSYSNPHHGWVAHDTNDEIIPNPAGAPPLDWWNIPPGGYPGAHYAVWPPELLIRPIKAMCPERVCRVCGRPSERITERTPEYAAARAAIGDFNSDRGPGEGFSGSRSILVRAVGRDITSAENITVGFTDCAHNDWRPGLILDPFAGSGTTLAVASGHGRDSIGIDLDERNYELALNRVGPLVLERGVAAA